MARAVVTASATLDVPASTAALDILEELRIRQIELEIQNEELRRAQTDLETSRERYFDLYNLAPVGYLSVNDEGLVRNESPRRDSLRLESLVP